jgi:hypothetical protein
LGNTIDGNIFNKDNDQEKKTLVNRIFFTKFREPQHVNWKHNFKIIMDAVEDYARRWIKREVDQDPEYSHVE